MDLMELINRFLSEQNGLGVMSIERVANYRFELVGTEAPFVHIGYVRFLKDLGIANPRVTHLNRHYISLFKEYLTQVHGTLPSYRIAIKIKEPKL